MTKGDYVVRWFSLRRYVPVPSKADIEANIKELDENPIYDAQARSAFREIYQEQSTPAWRRKEALGREETVIVEEVMQQNYLDGRRYSRIIKTGLKNGVTRDIEMYPVIIGDDGLFYVPLVLNQPDGSPVPETLVRFSFWSKRHFGKFPYIGQEGVVYYDVGIPYATEDKERIESILKSRIPSVSWYGEKAEGAGTSEGSVTWAKLPPPVGVEKIEYDDTGRYPEHYGGVKYFSIQGMANAKTEKSLVLHMHQLAEEVRR